MILALQVTAQAYVRGFSDEVKVISARNCPLLFHSLILTVSTTIVAVATEHFV